MVDMQRVHLSVEEIEAHFTRGHSTVLDVGGS